MRDPENRDSVLSNQIMHSQVCSRRVLPKSFVIAIGNVSLSAYRALSLIGLLVFSAMSSGCALNSDFGRVRSDLVTDDMHAWVGAAARKPFGVPPSIYPFTDEERLLRDYAYQIIEPPYERNKWYAVLNEYGLSCKFQPDWYAFDVSAYSRLAHDAAVSFGNGALCSAQRRYTQRCESARRVLRRGAPGARYRQAPSGNPDQYYGRGRGAGQRGGAHCRERADHCVGTAGIDRQGASYRYALERLVIATPAPMAAEVERSTALLSQR